MTTKHLNVELPETTMAVFNALWREYQSKMARVTKAGFADIVINRALKEINREMNPELPVSKREEEGNIF
jgi:hypothetical protein